MDNISSGVDRLELIQQGYRTAFINATENSSLAYKPEFVSNNPSEGQKVLSTVEKALQDCEEFIISVAFITKGGITPLKQTLAELHQRGIRGRILTTDYLNFSEPDALTQLHNFPNIEIRMYRTAPDDGFHTKGYIFRKDDIYQIIVGSSNLTMTALTRNKEWNTRVISTKDGEYAKDILEEFDAYWNSEHTLDYDAFIDEYSAAYRISRKQRDIAAKERDLVAYRLKPNKMQQAFTNSLEQIRAKGADRALLISATGTGKTYASAFALREQNPKRVLFLVHREQIAKQARDSYKKVFGSSKKYGLLSGNHKDRDVDLLFATMQTMSKEDVLYSFDPCTFSTIVIDEVHRAASESYRRIMRYFRPEFWLGMTATPERTDNKDNIYQIFDYNIAYEIRLQQALEDDLLCPFHYFGITDLALVGDGNSKHELREFEYLTSDERVRHITEKSEFYGYSGSRVKGLMFVSDRREGELLSRKLNERGLRTVFLSGDTSQEDRERCIERLETDDPNMDQLDYILTVDIFNEGVDIPQVNQVLLLRPTQSPIVFVQQLGRGLRKASDKEFVVIIDFIGNYTNNYMIPIALSGDRSYNKDNMRRYVSDGCRIIPGSSTIHFDEISRHRIYTAIDRADTNAVQLLQAAYTELKHRLGRIPHIEDYELFGAIDIQKIIAKCGSYYEFLVKYDKEYKVRLSDEECEIIRFLSQKLSKGKRKEELQLLKDLIVGDRDELDDEVRDLPANTPELVRTSVESVLTNRFAQAKEQEKYRHCILIEQCSGGYTLSHDFYMMLISNGDFAQMVRELLDYGLRQNDQYYNPDNRYLDTNLVLNQKYTYEEVTRLLNWERDINAQTIGGYKYDALTKTLPVFINYKKDKDAIQYHDRFVDPGNLIAASKHPRKYIRGAKKLSPDVLRIYKWTDDDVNNRIYLFIRKNKDDNEAKEFYFLGEVDAINEPEPIRFNYKDKKTGKIKTDDAFEIHYRLKNPVREDIYDYIESDIAEDDDENN